ncbi:hypothetical protein ABZP36_006788 [Zizania latifolia]
MEPFTTNAPEGGKVITLLSAPPGTSITWSTSPAAVRKKEAPCTRELVSVGDGVGSGRRVSEGVDVM